MTPTELEDRLDPRPKQSQEGIVVTYSRDVDKVIAVKSNYTTQHI